MRRAPPVLDPAAARPPGARLLGRRTTAPGAPRRLRPDGGRGAAGLAVARRRRASRARAPDRARHRRRRPTAASTRRSARSGRSTPLLDGWAGRRSSAGRAPGILGSATSYGHGGMAALDSAHAALALHLPTLLSPRISSSDPRPRHRGLSHHTATVLELLLGLGADPGSGDRSRGLADWRPMGSMRSTCRASSTPCTGSATTATTWPSSRWTSRPTRRAGFPP